MDGTGWIWFIWLRFFHASKIRKLPKFFVWEKSAFQFLFKGSFHPGCGTWWKGGLMATPTFQLVIRGCWKIMTSRRFLDLLRCRRLNVGAVRRLNFWKIIFQAAALGPSYPDGLQGVSSLHTFFHLQLLIFGQSPNLNSTSFMTYCAGRWLILFFWHRLEAHLPWRGPFVRRMPDLSQLLVVIRWREFGSKMHLVMVMSHKYLHLGRFRHVGTVWVLGSIISIHGDGWKSMTTSLCCIHVSGRKRV